jgi:6-phosphofructokinase 1
MAQARARRVGILTGGGDCPGLNAVIRAAARTAFNMGWEVYGVEDGFDGLLTRHVRRLTRRDVRGILQLGGTILGTTNRRNPFLYPVTRKGAVVETDRSAELVRNFRALGLRGLIAIGGDGTLGIAERLFRKGIPVVGVPKTIDNDIPATLITFGFDTAVSTATDALDRLHTTAEAHKRVMVVEVMGRHAGWIALCCGVAGGADVILIPEIPFHVDKVCETIRARARAGRDFSIVVVAEGASSVNGRMITRGPKEAGREVRLGGIAEWLAAAISDRCAGKETRSLVLGHLQRGGPPTSFDRLLGTRFGSAAMRLVAEERFGSMVSLDPPRVMAVPLRTAVGKGKLKTVPLESDVVRAARDMGIGFGD